MYMYMYSTCTVQYVGKYAGEVPPHKQIFQILDIATNVSLISEIISD
jgi:hypothetical protein